jgi:glycosyltransferase involved in cell wall biosynthesis
MKITVVVPTYLRPHDLARCLAALKLQTRPVDELWVIVRDTDRETWQFIESFERDSLPLHTAAVAATGVIAAMNIGIDSATGDIVAFTDDDAAPHPDWLERIEAYYLADEQIGGVGGRDWVYHGTKLEDGSQFVVGKLQWFGHLIGNHHIGIGAWREVDVLKGVNMSFRRKAIADLRFDQRMRGSGAQVHFEVLFSLTLRKRGWKLIYDQQITVDHFPAPRFDEDQRGQFNEIAWINATHNETLALLEHFTTVQRIVFLFWAVLIGSRSSFGFVQYLRFLPSEGNLARQKWLASLKGRWQGWLTWQKGHYLSGSNVSNNK